MSHKKYISEYKRPYKELKEDVVVDVLVLKEDITRLLKVHSIDQRHGAVITIWLYVISTRDPRRAVETKPRGILHARSETSYVTPIQKSFLQQGTAEKTRAFLEFNSQHHYWEKSHCLWHTIP